MAGDQGPLEHLGTRDLQYGLRGAQGSRSPQLHCWHLRAQAARGPQGTQAPRGHRGPQGAQGSNLGTYQQRIWSNISGAHARPGIQGPQGPQVIQDRQHVKVWGRLRT